MYFEESVLLAPPQSTVTGPPASLTLSAVSQSQSPPDPCLFVRTTRGTRQPIMAPLRSAPVLVLLAFALATCPLLAAADKPEGESFAAAAAAVVPPRRQPLAVTSPPDSSTALSSCQMTERLTGRSMMSSIGGTQPWNPPTLHTLQHTH